MYYKYTNQELFDKVTEALVAQGEPSIVSRGYGFSCAYFGSDNKRCAAGHLVPDELVGMVKERQLTSWNSLIRDIPALAEIGDNRLIDRLQMAHDGAYSYIVNGHKWRVRWVKEMQKTANIYELSTEKLEQLATEEWQNS